MNDHEPSHSFPVLDVEHLRTVCGGDLEFEREIIGDFMAQVDPLYGSLAAAVAANDAAGIRFAAHSLKGSSRSLGAVALAEACARLESMGQSGDLGDAPRSLEHAQAELTRFRQAIQIHLDRLAA